MTAATAPALRAPLVAVPAPGDPAASLEALYRRHFVDCCRWLRAMGAADGDLDDLAQDVFLIADRKLAEEQIDHPAAFLYQVARRVAADHRRRAFWRKLWVGLGDAAGDEADRSPGPLETLEAKEVSNLARALLGRLPARQRRAFVLFELEGYSAPEIAALEQTTVHAVWSRVSAGRKAFRAHADKARRARFASRDGGLARGPKGGPR